MAVCWSGRVDRVRSSVAVVWVVVVVAAAVARTGCRPDWRDAGSSG